MRLSYKRSYQGLSYQSWVRTAYCQASLPDCKVYLALRSINWPRLTVLGIRVSLLLSLLINFGQKPPAFAFERCGTTENLNAQSFHKSLNYCLEKIPDSWAIVAEDNSAQELKAHFKKGTSTSDQNLLNDSESPGISDEHTNGTAGSLPINKCQPRPAKPEGLSMPTHSRRPWEKFGCAPLDLGPLNLTAEQKQRIQDIRKETRIKTRDVRKALREKRLELRESMFDPEVKEMQLRQKHREVKKLQEQAEEAMFEDFLAIRALLSSEQKKHLPEIKPQPNEPLKPEVAKQAVESSSSSKHAD